MKWKYTNIQHPVRIKMGITPNEYCVFDIIYQSQSHPEYAVNGWAKNSYLELAAFLGFSKSTIHGIIDRGVEWGLIEVNEADPKLKKTTENWYNHAYIQDINGIEITPVRKTNAVRKQNGAVRKQNANRSETERNRSETERINKEIKNKREIKIKTHTIEKSESENFEIDPKYEIEKCEKEKSCAKKEKEKLPPGEKLIKDAFEKCDQFFKTWDDTIRRLCEAAGKNKPDEEFVYDELRKWLRRNRDNITLMQDPANRIMGGKSSLMGWMGIIKKNNQKHSGYGKTPDRKSKKENQETGFKSDRAKAEQKVERYKTLLERSS